MPVIGTGRKRWVAGKTKKDFLFQLITNLDLLLLPVPGLKTNVEIRQGHESLGRI